MYNTSHVRVGVLPVPITATLAAAAGLLAIVYVGMLAVAMTYGVLQIQAAQTVRDTSAAVGNLETTYLSVITTINNVNPVSLGFSKPSTVAYVTGSRPQPTVSLRTQ